jgi:hypothetical protein
MYDAEVAAASDAPTAPGGAGRMSPGAGDSEAAGEEDTVSKYDDDCCNGLEVFGEYM